jgi:hypothetical protein
MAATTNALSDKAQSAIVLVSLVLMAVGALTTNYGNSTIGVILGIVGIFGMGIKQALGSASSPIPTGLTNAQQALVTLMGIAFYTAGSVVAPLGAPIYISLALQIIGAVGLAIKEWLGTWSSAANLPNGVQSVLTLGSFMMLAYGQYNALQSPGSWPTTLALGLAAAIGLALQEWISPQPTADKTATEHPMNIPPMAKPS